MSNDSEYLTVKEAALEWKVTEDTIRSWVQAGNPKITVERTPGNQIRILKAGIVQSSIVQSSPAQSEAVRTSKEAADLALNKDKQVEAEIKTKLREKGFENLGEALEDMRVKEAEIDKLLESAKVEERAAITNKEQAEKNKDKAIRAFDIIKKREEIVDLRLERAIALEEKQKGQVAEYQGMIDTLEGLQAYHTENIQPCVNGIRMIRKALYTWIDKLNETDYDFSVLYNYLGKMSDRLDSYIAREDGGNNEEAENGVLQETPIEAYE